MKHKKEPPVDFEDFYYFLKTNPVPNGYGQLKNHKIFLTPHQKEHATNSILKWVEKIKKEKLDKKEIKS